MSVLQWLLLFLTIGGVIALYVVIKRREGPDLWGDMQSPDVEGQETFAPDPDSDFDPVPVSRKQNSDTVQFDGVLGADDLPDLPADSSPSLANDDDLPDFDVRPVDPVPDNHRSEPELNPAGLNRKSESEPTRIVVLHVACKDGQFFNGEEIHAALRECKLQFGMQDVYHRITEQNGVPEPVYSVANMLKPGFLNPDEAADLQTPGLALFMALPGPLDGVPACKEMMETANRLAELLHGEVLDDKRSLLKRQTAQYLLDEIAEDDRKRLIKAQHA